MLAEAVRLIREYAKPLTIIPAGATPRLKRLSGIKAVVFDVYGTLFMSASGDIGLTTETEVMSDAMAAALQSEGIVTAPSMRLATRWRELVREDQAHAREEGVAFPEVEVREIWKRLLGKCDLTLSEEAIARVAIRHESLVNPVWPMPDTLSTLLALRDLGFLMGIISNAQFYTPPVFEALLEHSLESLGFRHELCQWSFEQCEAKPSSSLFLRLAKLLAREGVPSCGVLYVGNDMRKDIATAAAAGFRTALFAGDARSLRRREEEGLEVEPDLVVTELGQLIDCVS